MKRLKILVSVGLLGVLAWRTDWTQVAHAFAHLRLELWAAAVGAYLAAQLCSVVRWQQLSRPLGFHQPLRVFLGYYCIGMFFNLLLPTSVGGDVVRAWYLDDGSGRRLPAFVSVFVERCSGLLVLLLLACAAVLFSPQSLPAWVAWSVWTTAGLLLLGGLVVWFRCGAPDSVEAEDGTSSPGKLAVLRSAISTLRTALVEQPGLLVTTTLLSVGVQAANVVLVWLVGLAIGAPVPASYYWVAVPMVSLLMVVLPSLNGHGVREGGLVLFLAEVGVPAGTALTLAFLWFSVMAAVSLAGGLVYLFGRFPRPEVRADHESLSHHSYQGRARQPATAA
ncbi:MAG: flippase-like domain-containing protein [Planctomycetia bacterium]|nr:flippase-like domain-containing protein [Planctomycetia bacterium]